MKEAGVTFNVGGPVRYEELESLAKCSYGVNDADANGLGDILSRN